jgi:hypothetical protein
VGLVLGGSLAVVVFEAGLLAAGAGFVVLAAGCVLVVALLVSLALAVLDVGALAGAGWLEVELDAGWLGTGWLALLEPSDFELSDFAPSDLPLSDLPLPSDLLESVVGLFLGADADADDETGCG